MAEKQVKGVTITHITSSLAGRSPFHGPACHMLRRNRVILGAACAARAHACNLFSDHAARHYSDPTFSARYRVAPGDNRACFNKAGQVYDAS